jgi:hypothetical protein
MSFVVTNPSIYFTNTSIHGLNTMQQEKLHVHFVRLSAPQKGVYYSSIHIFNHLPFTITKYKSDTRIFKTVLRSYLVDNAFYSIDEFLSTNCT